MRNKIILIFTVLLFMFGCSQKDEFYYYRESNKYLEANNRLEAENILKEGIQKLDKNSFLKIALFDLYLSSKGIDDAEAYFKVASFSFEDSTALYSKLATKFFEQKNWQKAYEYSLEQGSAYQIIGKEKQDCLKYAVAIEAYHNAAAAAYNLNDFYKVQHAYRNMKTSVVGNCIGAYETKQLSEVRGWLPNNLKD